MRCTNTVSSRWGLSRPAVNEYKTYSDAQIKVYKDDQLISSTDTSVSTQQRPLLTALLTFSQSDYSLEIHMRGVMQSIMQVPEDPGPNMQT